MSNMILAVIGIVLASAATLITINYGGEYFMDAAADGRAMQVETALNNVLAAYRLHEMKTNSAPADLAAILPGGSGLLKSLPVLPDGAAISPSWNTLTIDGASRRVVTVTGLSDEVCLALNKMADRDIIPTGPSGSIGCFSASGSPLAFRTL